MRMHTRNAFPRPRRRWNPPLPPYSSFISSSLLPPLVSSASAIARSCRSAIALCAAQSSASCSTSDGRWGRSGRNHHGHTEPVPNTRRKFLKLKLRAATPSPLSLLSSIKKAYAPRRRDS
ncbi:hypothetical protein TcCL_ESM03114 [Trypanosoma cruzi]|nr:hypothetical protein TcCL_ESM03114 [Trypanosoma cruzi]